MHGVQLGACARSTTRSPILFQDIWVFTQLNVGEYEGKLKAQVALKAALNCNTEKATHAMSNHDTEKEAQAAESQD